MDHVTEETAATLKTLKMVVATQERLERAVERLDTLAVGSGRVSAETQGSVANLQRGMDAALRALGVQPPPTQPVDGRSAAVAVPFASPLPVCSLRQMEGGAQPTPCEPMPRDTFAPPPSVGSLRQRGSGPTPLGLGTQSHHAGLFAGLFEFARAAGGGVPEPDEKEARRLAPAASSLPPGSRTAGERRRVLEEAGGGWAATEGPPATCETTMTNQNWREVNRGGVAMGVPCGIAAVPLSGAADAEAAVLVAGNGTASPAGAWVGSGIRWAEQACRRLACTELTELR
jgi:hypothetical protein